MHVSATAMSLFTVLGGKNQQSFHIFSHTYYLLVLLVKHDLKSQGKGDLYWHDYVLNFMRFCQLVSRVVRWSHQRRQGHNIYMCVCVCVCPCELRTVSKNYTKNNIVCSVEYIRCNVLNC